MDCDTSNEVGVEKLALNMRYNNILKQAHDYSNEINHFHRSIKELLQQLQEASQVRKASERATDELVRPMERVRPIASHKKNEAAMAVAETALIDWSDLPVFSQTPIDESPTPFNGPSMDTLEKMEANLENQHQLLRTFKDINCYLTREHSLLRKFCSPNIVLRFYHVSVKAPGVATPHFLSCPRDSRVEDIIASLPQQWNVSMQSTFQVPSIYSLCPFNTPGATLLHLPGWMKYLEFGGLVFVSDERRAPPAEVRSPPLEQESSNRKRNCEDLDTITEPASKKRKKDPMKKQKAASRKKAKTASRK